MQLVSWHLSMSGATPNPSTTNSKNITSINFFMNILILAVQDHLHIKIKFPVLTELVIRDVTAV